MHLRIKTALFAASLMMGDHAMAQPPAAAPSVRPDFAQGSLNVYRRFAPERLERMIAFYEKGLGLASLPKITLGDGQQVMLFRIGSGQIKLAAGLKPGRLYHPGAADAATGIRLYTLFFAEESALAARFAAAGFPAPRFQDRSDGTRTALVRDPGGFTLQLIIVANAPAETYGKVEVGINVSDLARSRAFYRDFAGLEELPPVKDATLGVTKYPYRHGETTINLWSFGKALPADTGSGGIQYVIRNIDAVNADAARRKVTVEEPLAAVPGFPVRTVWLNDPDGVTNYFYERASPAK